MDLINELADPHELRHCQVAALVLVAIPVTLGTVHPTVGHNHAVGACGSGRRLVTTHEGVVVAAVTGMAPCG